MTIPAQDYVEHFDKSLAAHRDFLLAALLKLELYEPGALQEGSPLRRVWQTTEADVPNTWDGIKAAAQLAGAKYPALVAAQWQLESGGGKQTPAGAPNNLFGLKGKGPSSATKEQGAAGLEPQVAQFINFPTRRAAVEHLVRLWYKDYRASGRSYKGVNNAPTIEAAARDLRAQGYATDGRSPDDPEDYADKLIRILNERGEIASAPRLTLPAQQGRLEGLRQPLVIPGRVGPLKTPYEFGFKALDTHLIVDDGAETMTAWSFQGELLWEIPALARGQGRDTDWQNNRTDTPPGLWKLGKPVYNDIAKYGKDPDQEYPDLRAYGWIFFPMVGLEGQEDRFDRRGIGLHGGGSGNGWPGAWAPKQPLLPTFGCVRIWNSALKDLVLPLYQQGTVFLSCYQERA